MKKSLLLILATGILSLFIMYKYKQQKMDSVPNESIIIGTNAEYQPFCFVENNEIVGFDIDIAKEAIKRLGKKVIMKDMSWEALVSELQMGTVHLVAAGMTPSKEKAEVVYFTKPHLSGDPLVIITTAENKTIQSVDDLKGKTVIVNSGYTSDLYMSKFPEIKLLRLNNPADAFTALNAQKADAFISATNAVKPFFEQYKKDAYTITEINGTDETYSLVISKKYPKLYKQISSIMLEMTEDGTITHFKNKWKL